MRLSHTISSLMVALSALCLSASITPAAAQGVRQQLSAESALETIKKRGSMQIGVSSFIPWAMRAKSGELVGFEIDVAKNIAEEMGVKPEFVPTPFDGIIPALLAGKFDIIITGIGTNLKYNLSVNFSNPYNWLGQSMVSNKKLTANFKSTDDYNATNVTFAIRRGNEFGKKIIGTRWPKAQVLQFDDDAQAVQDVINGKAYAFVTSEPKPTNYALDYPEVLYKPFGDELLMRSAAAFAVRKGDYDMVNWLNNWIILRTEDGWLLDRHKYWFKGREWKSQVD
ncbi:MAG: transporter substrate-binding domain-containing protein [Alphaproteobacteria bacterium]|nr:transporter substrate-binding domain-containing protein [Alphaproteobacteria bacterium]